MKFCNIPISVFSSEDFLPNRTKGFKHFVTLNAQIIRLANEDLNYMAILNNTENSIDGRIPLFFFRRMWPEVNISQVSGSRELIKILDFVLSNDSRIYFVGASDGANECICKYINEASGKLLADYYPNAHINLPINELDNSKILESVAIFRPEIIVASLGAPKQEFWIESCQNIFNEIGVLAAYGLGGSVEMFANPRKLAPYWISIAGLESVWRLLSEPFNVNRYRRIIYSIGFLKYLKS